MTSVHHGAVRRTLVFLTAASALFSLGLPAAVVAQDATPAAWRVECGGDGKTLECRAVQQLVAQENKQLVIQLAARLGPDKMPVLGLQLPLGINLAEPIQLKVTVFDANKRAIAIDVPLLGFGLAFDKATRP